MDSARLTLQNYSRLRDKHAQMEMPPKGMSTTIDASLELLRILFMINELLNLEGQFTTKFEELLKHEELFCKHSECKVKPALIRSCVYEVFETGSCSVKLWISDKCRITIPEGKLYYIVKGCDIIIEQLIEQHRESSFTKCEGHSTSCLICRCGNMGIFKSSVTPIQECTDVKSNDIVSSLDADTNKNQPEESTDGSKEPSPSQASECSVHKQRGISESSDLDTEDNQPQETKDDSKEKNPMCKNGSSSDLDTEDSQPQETKDDSKEQSTSPASEYSIHKSRDISELPDLDAEDKRAMKTTDSVEKKSEEPSTSQAKPMPKWNADSSSDIPQTPDSETKDNQPQETTDDSKVSSTSQGSEYSFHKSRDISESSDLDTEDKRPSKTTDSVENKSKQSQDSTSTTEKFEKLKAKRIKQFKEFYENNREKIRQERTSSRAKSSIPIKCILLFWEKTKKNVDYKLFPHKQDALKWIHEPENRERLEDYHPFVHTIVVAEDTGELKITDLMVFDIEVINPSTGSVCVTQKASFDTGADIASFPYHPSFKELIHGAMLINDSEDASTIVYAQVKVKGEMIKKIFPIEIETDEEWCAFGLGQMEQLGTNTGYGVMQKITNIVVKR